MVGICLVEHVCAHPWLIIIALALRVPKVIVPKLCVGVPKASEVRGLLDWTAESKGVVWAMRWHWHVVRAWAGALGARRLSDAPVGSMLGARGVVGMVLRARGERSWALSPWRHGEALPADSFPSVISCRAWARRARARPSPWSRAKAVSWGAGLVRGILPYRRLDGG